MKRWDMTMSDFCSATTLWCFRCQGMSGPMIIRRAWEPMERRKHLTSCTLGVEIWYSEAVHCILESWKFSKRPLSRLGIGELSIEVMHRHASDAGIDSRRVRNRTRKREPSQIMHRSHTPTLPWFHIHHLIKLTSAPDMTSTSRDPTWFQSLQRPNHWAFIAIQSCWMQEHGQRHHQRFTIYTSKTELLEGVQTEKQGRKAEQSGIAVAMIVSDLLRVKEQGFSMLMIMWHHMEVASFELGSGRLSPVGNHPSRRTEGKLLWQAWDESDSLSVAFSSSNPTTHRKKIRLSIWLSFFCWGSDICIARAVNWLFQEAAIEVLFYRELERKANP